MIIGTTCLNFSRVDSPYCGRCGSYYTCECDIISRTYPIRWSSQLALCSWKPTAYEIVSYVPLATTLPKIKAQTKKLDSQSEILIFDYFTPYLGVK